MLAAMDPLRSTKQASAGALLFATSTTEVVGHPEAELLIADRLKRHKAIHHSTWVHVRQSKWTHAGAEASKML
jgi:hypothetical protein